MFKEHQEIGDLKGRPELMTKSVKSSLVDGATSGVKLTKAPRRLYDSLQGVRAYMLRMSVKNKLNSSYRGDDI